MKVLIGEQYGNSGQRKRKQDGDCGHRRPLRRRLSEAAAADSPATEKDEKDCGSLPQQDRPRQWKMRQTNRERDEFIEDRSLKLQPEEIRIMGKQRWVQISLDGRQVKRVIFQPRMVAHDQKGAYGQSGQQGKILECGTAGFELALRRVRWRAGH